MVSIRVSKTFRVSSILAALAILCSCAGYQPSCADNPRNMKCMSAKQLEKELAE